MPSKHYAEVGKAIVDYFDNWDNDSLSLYVVIEPDADGHPASRVFSMLIDDEWSGEIGTTIYNLLLKVKLINKEATNA